MTTDSTPAPEEEPSLPDDIWERFARDTEREIRDNAPKEPSARARIVARRLREQDERSAAVARRGLGRRGLGRRGGDSPRGDTAWRSGSTDAAERLLRRRGRLHSALAILLVVLLVLVALSPSRAWSFLTGKGWRHDGSAGPVPTGPHSGFPYWSTLAGDSAGPVPTGPQDTTDLFARLGPEARPAGAVVKVRGRTTVRTGDLGGAGIDADHTFVYPTRKIGDTGASPETARTIVRRTVSFQLPDPARYRRTAGRLVLTHWNGDTAHSSCGIHDGMLHPEFGAGPIAGASPSGSPTPVPTPSGPATGRYDRSKPITADRPGECGRASRI